MLSRGLKLTCRAVNLQKQNETLQKHDKHTPPPPPPPPPIPFNSRLHPNQEKYDIRRRAVMAPVMELGDGCVTPLLISLAVTSISVTKSVSIFDAFAYSFSIRSTCMPTGLDRSLKQRHSTGRRTTDGLHNL